MRAPADLATKVCAIEGSVLEEKPLILSGQLWTQAEKILQYRDKSVGRCSIPLHHSKAE